MHFGEREARASGSGFRKTLFYIYIYIYIFFNIMLTWKIVEVSEVLVLYKYIDDLFLYQMRIN